MQISEQDVRECAYYIWENEGRIHGQAVAHWIRAETELRANVALAAGEIVTKVAQPSVTAPATKAATAKTPAKTAAKGATKAAAPAVEAAKAATKPAVKLASKPAAPAKVAKPTAPKPARASKAAVTAGLAAKAKPARTPAAMH